MIPVYIISFPLSAQYLNGYYITCQNQRLPNQLVCVNRFQCKTDRRNRDMQLNVSNESSQSGCGQIPLGHRLQPNDHDSWPMMYIRFCQLRFRGSYYCGSSIAPAVMRYYNTSHICSLPWLNTSPSWNLLQSTVL